MFKWVSILGALILSLNAQAWASNTEYKEGVHYTALPVAKSEQPQLTKFFSFFCGACYNIEPVIQRLEPKLPADVKVQKIHVDFVRGASPEIMSLLSRGALLAKQTERGAAFHNAVFRQIHVSKTPFRTEKDVELALLAAGFDQAQAQAGLKSFAINGQYQNGEKKMKHYVSNRYISGVPTLIVNDKYRIQPGALDPKNFEEELRALTEYLLTL